jgi:hypothetical protein
MFNEAGALLYIFQPVVEIPQTTDCSSVFMQIHGKHVGTVFAAITDRPPQPAGRDFPPADGSAPERTERTGRTLPKAVCVCVCVCVWVCAVYFMTLPVYGLHIAER